MMDESKTPTLLETNISPTSRHYWVDDGSHVIVPPRRPPEPVKALEMPRDDDGATRTGDSAPPSFRPDVTGEVGTANETTTRLGRIMLELYWNCVGDDGCGIHLLFFLFFWSLSGWTSKDWEIWIWFDHVLALVERVGHPRPHEGAVQQNCSWASKPKVFRRIYRWMFSVQYWCYAYRGHQFILVRCFLRSRLGLSGITFLCPFCVAGAGRSHFTSV